MKSNSGENWNPSTSPELTGAPAVLFVPLFTLLHWIETESPREQHVEITTPAAEELIYVRIPMVLSKRRKQ